MQRNIKTCLITIMLVLIVLSVQQVDAFLDEFEQGKAWWRLGSRSARCEEKGFRGMEYRQR